MHSVSKFGINWEVMIMWSIIEVPLWLKNVGWKFVILEIFRVCRLLIRGLRSDARSACGGR